MLSAHLQEIQPGSNYCDCDAKIKKKKIASSELNYKFTDEEKKEQVLCRFMWTRLSRDSYSGKVMAQLSGRKPERQTPPAHVLVRYS